MFKYVFSIFSSRTILIQYFQYFVKMVDFITKMHEVYKYSENKFYMEMVRERMSQELSSFYMSNVSRFTLDKRVNRGKIKEWRISLWWLIESDFTWL